MVGFRVFGTHNLLAIVPASKRIRIVGPEVAEHDLTRPLIWLAGLESPV
jgi:hypothetical protein